MATLRTLIRFAALFGGRSDAYFESYAKGGRAVWQRVTLPLFARHLSGDIEIGTYPVIDTAHCRWGCIDIDIPDSDSHALDLATDVSAAWRFFKVHSWVERSRSKGYHIWIFADDWVSAAVMRDAGRWIAKLADLDPKTEINPKNAAPWLTANGLVNTVRTPYSGRANPGRMVVIDDNGAPIPLAEFVDSAYALRTQRQALSQLSESMRQVDRANRRALEMSHGPSDGATAPRLRGFTKQQAALILAGQARAQLGERDNQFFTMAKLLRATDTPYELAERIITQRWAETDTTDFPLSVALAKLERVYR